MISVDEHLATVLAAVHPLDLLTVPLAEALGSTLRTGVRAAVDLPLFDNSAMDGFAVRFADVATASAASPVALRVVADLPAGSALDPAFGAGEAVADHDRGAAAHERRHGRAVRGDGRRA